MKRIDIFQVFAVTLVSAGLIVPQALAAEASVGEQAEATAVVTDVALTTGGVLRGQVVDTQGHPVAKAPVAVMHEGKTVANTVTGADGSFAISNIRSGLHVVASGQNGGLCRMWAANSAPPVARQGVMIVKGSQLVRGQSGNGAGLLMAGAVGGIVAGGVISQGDHGNDNNHGSGS